jgi:addiction module HigA family antidote
MNRKPTSPGEILNDEFLKPLDLTQKELANQLDCDGETIGKIVQGREIVTPEIASKLAAAFETTPDFWLNAQKAVDQWKLEAKQS